MNNRQRHTSRFQGGYQTPSKQRGISMVLFTIGMLIIVLIGGLALDMAHALLNKSRLQNSVDAAALAAAAILEDSTSTSLAEDAAIDVFEANQNAAGNSELLDAITEPDIVVEFSETLEPFSPGATDGLAEYVRVRVERFSMPAWLIQIWERADGTRFTTKTVGASAVAGPSPTLGNACDIVPLIICGDEDAGPPYYGYENEEVVVLKGGSQSGNESGDIGPGNFQLAQLGGSGLDVVRENLAGGYEGCAIQDSTIPTQTGVGSGPVAQGMNTRLGDFAGPVDEYDPVTGEGYLPDVITETPKSWVPGDGDISYDTTNNQAMYNGNPITDSLDLAFNYDTYKQELTNKSYNNDPPKGAFDRRNLSVVIAQCDAAPNTGNSDLPILGFGCFFLLQEVAQKGNEAEIYGEFVTDCNAKGNAGPVPVDIPGPNKIQLYNDPDSKDS